MKTKHLLLLFIPLLLALKCEKDPPLVVEPPVQDTTFPMRFVFVNKDTSVLSVKLQSEFYDVITNTSTYFTKGYGTSPGSEFPLVINDTIVHDERTAVMGCKRAFEIRVLWRNTLPQTPENPYNKYSWKVYRSNILPFRDSIKGKEDGLDLFVWPDDSAKYHLIEYFCCAPE